MKKPLTKKQAKWLRWSRSEAGQKKLKAWRRSKKGRAIKQNYRVKSPRNTIGTSLRNALTRRPNCTPITLDELMAAFVKQKGCCALTGIKMTWGTGLQNGIPLPTSISIDRIKPELGYVSGNVRLILFCINSFRLSMTDAEMRKVARALLKGKKK